MAERNETDNAEKRWKYNQRTGQLRDPDGKLVPGKGYSGAPGYVNMPETQHRPFEGPIPRGNYTITREKESKGPVTLELEPDGHDACGRDQLLIHGDSIKNPGTASMGCIILGRKARNMMSKSEGSQRRIEVVDEPEWKK